MFLILLVFLTGLSIFSFWKHYNIVKKRGFMMNKKRNLAIPRRRIFWW